MDIGTGISAVQTAIDCGKMLLVGLKAVRETDKKLNVLELTEKLIEQQNILVDAKDQINGLSLEIQKLRHQLQIKDELQFDNDAKVYWRLRNNHNEGPFCATCFGDEGKVIPLNESGTESWHCTKCKNHFETGKQREERRGKYSNQRQHRVI